MKRLQHLGDTLFVASYFLFVVFCFGLFSKTIFRDDALHIALGMHLLGHLVGGRKLGGVRILEFVKNAQPFLGIYVVWSLLWGGIGVLRHRAFYTEDLDLGIYSQVIWNLSRGNGFQSTLAPSGTLLSLADHQNYTDLLFAPLFWTPWGPELLILAQSFLLFLPGYWFAKWILRKNLFHYEPQWITRLSWLAFLGWMLFTPLVQNTFWDYHQKAVITPALALWSLAIFQGNAWAIVGFALLAGLAKEHLLILTLVGYPIAFFMHPSRIKSFLPKFALGAVLQIAVFGVGALWFSQSDFTLRYSHLGQSVLEIALSPVLEPRAFWGTLFEWPRIHFFLEIFSPLLFTTLLSGWLGLAWVPFFLCHALSNWPHQISTHYQYVLEIWPSVFVGALVGWKSILKRRHAQVIVGMILLSVLWNMPNSAFNQFTRFKDRAIGCHPVRTEVREWVLEKKKQCGKALVGAAGTKLFPHLVDLVPLHTSRKINEYPNRPQDQRPERSTHFKQDFSGQGCRFLVGSHEEIRDFLSDVGGGFTKIKSWSGCFPTTLIELWEMQD